jgi:hypothetical protein
MKIQNYIPLTLLSLLLSQCKKGPEFDSLIPFQEKENSYWGYIDFNGSKKIDPKFKNLPGLFYNGYALIKTTDGSVDYIDNKGSEFERNYINATDFHEGIAFAVKEGEYPTLLNSKLEEVKVLEKVDEINVPNEGLICFKNTQGKWGFMNNDGEIAIKPIYDNANNFSEGLALIGKTEYDTANGGKTEKVLYGFIDTKGNEVIKPTLSFKSIRSFAEDLAAYSDGDDWGWGFIDKTGKKVIRAKQEWEEVTDFHEGVASVKIGSLWGAIDNKGKMIINPKFEVALFFDNGLSYGEKDDKIGFINKKGDWVIEPSFDNIVLGFSRRKAIVEKDNYYIFIDKKGNQKKNREFYNVSLSHLFNGSVKSDFFDIEPVIDTLISQLSAGSINGISSQTGLDEVMKKYNLNNAVLPDNSWQTSLEVRKVEMDGEINSTVILYFNKNISQEITRRISEYWYSYNEVIGYKPNTAALVTSVEFNINLEGRKEGKADKLAKGFKSIFELNGFTLNKETSSSENYFFTTTEGGPKASIQFDKSNVKVSLVF